jgi:hypothetical protein
MMQHLAKRKSLVLSGPLWLFQLWLVATFEKQLKFYTPKILKDEIDGRTIEVTRLAYLKRREINLSQTELFSRYFKVFLNYDSFDPTMAPFIS